MSKSRTDLLLALSIVPVPIFKARWHFHFTVQSGFPLSRLLSDLNLWWQGPSTVLPKSITTSTLSATHSRKFCKTSKNILTVGHDYSYVVERITFSIFLISFWPTISRQFIKPAVSYLGQTCKNKCRNTSLWKTTSVPL